MEDKDKLSHALCAYHKQLILSILKVNLQVLYSKGKSLAIVL